MALAWALRHKTMTSVLVGASRMGQIEDNVGALSNAQFTEKELADIEGVLAA
jgi:L-glyceraldehyde 3-phosphate reductase